MKTSLIARLSSLAAALTVTFTVVAALADYGLPQEAAGVFAQAVVPAAR
jgi:hypothetical protein